MDDRAPLPVGERWVNPLPDEASRTKREKSQYVLALRGEYASAYGAELRSVFLRLPQYDRLASLGHDVFFTRSQAYRSPLCTAF